MTQYLTRRTLGLGVAALALSACTKASINANATTPRQKGSSVNDNIDWASLSPTDWKERLTPAEFNVLRREGTERPWSSPLNDEKRDGVFACRGCELPLFNADTKYDSRTGWPSFFDVIEGNVATKVDNKLFLPRTEYHCARCGGHQGHVFTDGPRPTGLRYCNNGVALIFIPKDA